MTNDLPKEICCLLPRRHILFLGVHGRFSSLSFTGDLSFPRKQVAAFCISCDVGFQRGRFFASFGWEKWTILFGLPHPGEWQNQWLWVQTGQWLRELEIMRTAKLMLSRCLAWICMLRLKRFESRQRAFSYPCLIHTVLEHARQLTEPIWICGPYLGELAI